jgi:SNF2 family DNA or RNA helicase
MAPAQKKQYREFAKMAEVMIGDEQLTATGILAEFTRLKQFAGALQDVKPGSEGKLRALPVSGKLTQLEDDFVHLGILDRDDATLVAGEDDSQQAVVASQFSEIIDMLYDHFVGLGLPCLKLTGDVNGRGERAAVVRSFQAGEARVMFMTTQTGGVSITLDRASNVFVMDEMWDPDKQRQLEDRCHRASRIHQVTVRYYRSKGTIEQYIAEVTAGKQDVNDAILAGQVRLWGG